jgi:hypothetical protein
MDYDLPPVTIDIGSMCYKSDVRDFEKTTKYVSDLHQAHQSRRIMTQNKKMLVNGQYYWVRFYSSYTRYSLYTTTNRIALTFLK